MRLRGFIVLCLLGCAGLFAGRTAAQGKATDISVTVSLDRDTIGLNETALLTVEISGPGQDLPRPNVPNLVRFEMYSQGRSSNISIVNGHVSSTMTYRYMLIPSKAGTYPITGIALVYNNHRYKGNEVDLTVLNKGTATPPELEKHATDQNGSSKDYFLEAVVDKSHPYVNEQVTLTLKFYTAVQYYGSPELTEPTTTGFWNELLGNKAPYRQKIGNRIYRVIERKYALFPTQTGKLTIGAASIRATVANQNTAQRDPFGMFNGFFNNGKDVTIRSHPVTINARPLPLAGRPSNFTGSIGDFSISTSVDKRQVDVNQPVTVTIKITGTGNIKSAAEPPIPNLDDFRVYLASTNESTSKVQDRLGGTKTYEQVFIPKRPGQLQIPSLTYNYFDPLKKQYRTITTRPIGIKVTQPAGYAGPTDDGYAGPDVVVGASAKDIRYIKDNLGSTSSKGRIVLLSPLYLAVNGIPVLLLAGTIMVRKRREKLASNIGYARSLQAGKKARKRLARARSLARLEQGGDFFAELHMTLTAYIADKLNISPHGLTTDRIKELLATRSADEALTSDTIGVLQQCDFARFAPASVTQEDIDNALRTGEEVMIKLEGVHFA